MAQQFVQRLDRFYALTSDRPVETPASASPLPNGDVTQKEVDPENSNGHAHEINGSAGNGVLPPTNGDSD